MRELVVVFPQLFLTPGAPVKKVAENISSHAEAIKIGASEGISCTAATNAEDWTHPL